MSDAVELPPEGGAAPIASDMPYWRMVLWTPVSEILRGRVTGPIARSKDVESADLPLTLTALVADVVGRTRLWSSEQRDIKRELSSHFVDGLASGRSQGDLIADFGDPAQAAQLLRRAAKRNRPWPWQAVRVAMRATAVVVGIVLLLYGLMALRFYFSRPTISTDYRVQLNAAASAVPDSDRAWPLYREALLALPKELPEAVVDRKYSRMPLPGEPGWETVEAYLRESAPAFAFARQASERRGMGFIVGYALSPEDQKLWPGSTMDEREFTSPEGGGMISVLLPHLGSLRSLAKAVGWDIQRAAAAGDASTVLINLQTLLAISRHVRETPTFISDLVGLSVFAVARDRIDAILADKPELLSDAQWVEAAHALAAFDDATLHVNMRGERLFFGDVLQRLYTDDGSGDGRLTPHGLKWIETASGGVGQGQQASDPMRTFGGPAMASVMLGRRDMQEQYERLVGMYEAEAATPLWLRDDSPAELILQEWMASPVQRLRHLPLCLLMPAIGKASINAEMAKMRRDATLTVIALELHRRAHGGWPASVDELVPGLLPALPADRFDGQTLRYRLVDGRPLVYSVGSDREDDGGVLPPTGDGGIDGRQWYAQRWLPPSEVARQKAAVGPLPNGATGTALDGDWLLWPPLPKEPLRVDDSDDVH